MVGLGVAVGVLVTDGGIFPDVRVVILILGAFCPVVGLGLVVAAGVDTAVGAVGLTDDDTVDVMDAIAGEGVTAVVVEVRSTVDGLEGVFAVAMASGFGVFVVGGSTLGGTETVCLAGVDWTTGLVTTGVAEGTG